MRMPRLMGTPTAMATATVMAMMAATTVARRMKAPR